MGGRNSKNTNSSNNNTDFCPLRVASIYVDLGESINKKKKIKAMVDYYMHDYYSYKLDILCLQGIKSYKILKELITAFKTYIEAYNDKYAKNGQDIYLEYFPDVEVKQANDEMNWSTSETEETDFFDKLIITRHEILSKATPALGVRDDAMHSGYGPYTNYAQNNEYLKRGENILFNRDSDRLYDGKRHIQVANINVNGTYVSVYNVELKSDVKGIRSSKERKSQIFDLKELINQNVENSKDERVREFEYGDDTFIAHNRNIHIVTGMFHVNEMRNDEFNPEYIRTVKLLDGLDAHRWVMAFRNRYKPESTNIKFSKDSYTLLISEPILDNENLQDKAKKLYQEHKVLITSSIIMRNSVDMSYFTNYPIDTLFMIYKPKIGYTDNKNRPDYFIRQEAFNRINQGSTRETRKSSKNYDNSHDTRSRIHSFRGYHKDRDTDKDMNEVISNHRNQTEYRDTRAEHHNSQSHRTSTKRESYNRRGRVDRKSRHDSKDSDNGESNKRIERTHVKKTHREHAKKYRKRTESSDTPSDDSRNKSHTRERITRLITSDRIHHDTKKKSNDKTESKTKGKNSRAKSEAKKKRTRSKSILDILVDQDVVNKTTSTKQKRKKEKSDIQGGSEDNKDKIQKIISSGTGMSNEHDNLLIDRYEPPEKLTRIDQVDATNDTDDSMADAESPETTINYSDNRLNGTYTDQECSLNDIELEELDTTVHNSPEKSVEVSHISPQESIENIDECNTSVIDSDTQEEYEDVYEDTYEGVYEGTSAEESAEESAEDVESVDNMYNDAVKIKGDISSSSDSDPIIHHGTSLMNNNSVDIDTDSENDYANDEILRIIDDE
jgi:hypothetical protein